MPDYSALKKNISKLIAEQMRRNQVTGLSIALVDDQEVAWAEGFGYANRRRRVLVTADTVFRAGSITKLFTAAAIMQLVERGRIDLDAPVQQYLPEFSVRTRFHQAVPITVRSLMTHHSGLPSDNFKDYLNEDSEAFHSAIDYLREHHAAFPPDYLFSYSNLNASLLGMIVERVSGETFRNYLADHILKPLKMARTDLKLTGEIYRLLARPYHRGRFETELPLRDLPAGGLYSNVVDLANFIKMVHRGARQNPEGTRQVTGGCGEDGSSEFRQILRPETLEQMLTVQNPDNYLDFDMRVGLSWMIGRSSLDHAGKVCWHDGGTIHYNSMLVILPEHLLGVVILSNSDTGYPVVSRVADETLRMALEIKSALKPGRSQMQIGATAQFPDFKISKFAGEFATLWGLVAVSKLTSGFRAQLMGKDFAMPRHLDGWFELRPFLLGMLPLAAPRTGGLRLLIDYVDNEKILALEQQVGLNRLRAAVGRGYQRNLIPPVWSDRAGRYRAIDKNPILQEFSLVFNKGLLYIDATVRKIGKLKLIIEPVSKSEGIIAGLGRFARETVYCREIEGEAMLEIYGLSFKRLGR